MVNCCPSTTQARKGANHMLNVSRLNFTRRYSCAVFQIFSAEICMLIPPNTRFFNDLFTPADISLFSFDFDCQSSATGSDIQAKTQTLLGGLRLVSPSLNLT